MAYGPSICAACGSGSGVQEHHLVPRSMGGGELPTVWLCHLCHGLVHGRRVAVNSRELTKAALAAARARGVKLGGYRGGPVPDTAAAAEARKMRADTFATLVGPIARELQAEGKGLETIAAELTRRGIKTARGGKWAAQTVKNVLARGAGRA